MHHARLGSPSLPPASATAIELASSSCSSRSSRFQRFCFRKVCDCNEIVSLGYARKTTPGSRLLGPVLAGEPLRLCPTGYTLQSLKGRSWHERNAQEPCTRTLVSNVHLRRLNALSVNTISGARHAARWLRSKRKTKSRTISLADSRSLQVDLRGSTHRGRVYA
jgi:hypothetical protein